MADWNFRGDVLVSARQAAKLSQRELASAVNVAGADGVSLWERGVVRPQPRVIPLLARHLGIDPLSLLDGDRSDPDVTHLRVAAGMSLREMAARAGLPIASYHRLERRGAPQGGLDEDTAKAIAGALGIKPARLVRLLDRRGT